MAGPQINNLQILDDTDPFLTRSIETTDELQIGAETTFTADVTIDANLVVTGTTTSTESETVRIADNHIYLNDGYETAVAQTGGLVVNYLPLAPTDSVNGAFTAGVAATSNPTVVTTGSGTYSAGQFIQITGADNPQNNGLFEVLSHVGTTLTIRGIGTTATVEDFTQNQFAASSVVAGTITRVNLAVLRAGTDGIFETAVGNTTPLSFSDIGSGSGNSLQQAYVTGNTITTSVGEGDVVISGTEQVLITATGGLDIDTVLDFDGTSFDVQMTGTNGFSIDGTAASNVTVTAGDLDLGTVTSGDVNMSAAGEIDIDGTSAVNIDSAAGFSVDGNAASNVSVDGANLTLSTTTSGNVVASAAGDVDVDGTNVTVDATAGVSIDAAAASNMTVTGANLTLSTVTSGDVDIAAAGNADIVATGNVDIDGTVVTLDATGAFSIDGAAASNVSVATTGSGQDLTLSVTGATDSSVAISSTGTGGDAISMTATAGGIDITPADNLDAALVIADGGGQEYIEIDSRNGQEKIILKAPVCLDAGVGIGVELTATDTLVEGDLVRVDSSGQWNLADADSTFLDALVVGVSTGSFTATNPARCVTVHGSLVPVRFSAAPGGGNNGRPVFLSTTPGVGTLTPPTGSGTVRYQVGILVGADGADTTPNVLWAPQYISRTP